MERLPSSEFRKRFAGLTEATEVTVHGHVIGEWRPVGSALYVTVAQAKERLTESVQEVMAERNPYREFRPAPKSGKK